MTKDQAKEKKWAAWQRVARYADFLVLQNVFGGEFSTTDFDVSGYPPWVIRAGKKVVPALFPKLYAAAKDESLSEPYRIGLWFGGMEAGQRNMNAILAPLVPDSLPPPTEEQEKQAKKIFWGPAASDFQEATDDLIPAEIRREVEATVSGFTTSQTAEFLQGQADAHRMTAGENRATSTTQIYVVMLLFWRVVEAMPRIEVLESTLTKILGRNIVGSDPRYLRQLCYRVGKAFRPPGRPRKTTSKRKAR